MITTEQFDKFKVLMRKRLGKEAYGKKTEQELMDSTIKLLTLVKAVYKPMTKEK